MLGFYRAALASLMLLVMPTLGSAQVSVGRSINIAPPVLPVYDQPPIPGLHQEGHEYRLGESRQLQRWSWRYYCKSLAQGDCRSARSGSPYAMSFPARCEYGIE
jgi:hypothetical protein